MEVLSLGYSPWRDWEEWRSVKEGLFSKKNKCVKQALEHVEKWRKTRKLPVAVDGTAMLIEAGIGARGLSENQSR